MEEERARLLGWDGPIWWDGRRVWWRRSHAPGCGCISDHAESAAVAVTTAAAESAVAASEAGGAAATAATSWPI